VHYHGFTLVSGMVLVQLFVLDVSALSKRRKTRRDIDKKKGRRGGTREGR